MTGESFWMSTGAPTQIVSTVLNAYSIHWGSKRNTMESPAVSGGPSAAFCGGFQAILFGQLEKLGGRTPRET